MSTSSSFSSLWDDGEEERPAPGSWSSVPRSDKAKGDVQAVAIATACGAATSTFLLTLSNQTVPFFLRPMTPALRPLLLIPPLFPLHNRLLFTQGKRSRYLYANTAFGIGVVAASAYVIVRNEGGSIFLSKSEGHLPFGLFMGSLCFYHLAEYLLVAYYNPTMLSVDSFLVQTHYVGAMAVSLCEYFFTKAMLPGMKGWAPVTWLGLAGMVFGETFRKGALIQAGHNFTHQISDGYRREEHELVTHGLYSISRHPGYFGWFWWSISSQVLLSNPVSTALFAAAAWKFFRDRIPYEEAHLQRFFPQYREYKKRVPTRIPWIP